MSKVTSKLQVTIPKVVADRFRIRPGDDIQWSSEGESLRVRVGREVQAPLGVTERLRLFDEATNRQKKRQRGTKAKSGERGWTREELYTRGRTR